MIAFTALTFFSVTNPNPRDLPEGENWDLPVKRSNMIMQSITSPNWEKYFSRLSTGRG